MVLGSGHKYPHTEPVRYAAVLYYRFLGTILTNPNAESPDTYLGSAFATGTHSGQ